MVKNLSDGMKGVRRIFLPKDEFDVYWDRIQKILDERFGSDRNKNYFYGKYINTDPKTNSYID